jgi:hypothetical protein
MRSPAEHVDGLFARQVQSFAAELDQRAHDRYPSVLAQALAAYGIPREQMSGREQAFVDALLAGTLQIVGEIVGLAMRQSADLVGEALAGASFGFPDMPP